jgi:hypothetical protein
MLQWCHVYPIWSPQFSNDEVKINHLRFFNEAKKQVVIDILGHRNSNLDALAVGFDFNTFLYRRVPKKIDETIKTRGDVYRLWVVKGQKLKRKRDEAEAEAEDPSLHQRRDKRTRPHAP